MPLTDQNLDKALHLTGEVLALWKKQDFHLIVCGGSALLAQNVVSRATHDVDVLATRDLEYGISTLYPLPDTLKEAAKEAARELGLEPNWLNANASLHFPGIDSLPGSFWQEMETRRYGNYLQIDFVGRSGQILLKLYAALNRQEPRDLEDLRALAPDAQETEEGLRWVLKAFDGLTNIGQLPNLLSYLGHARLTEKFPS